MAEKAPGEAHSALRGLFIKFFTIQEMKSPGPLTVWHSRSLRSKHSAPVLLSSLVLPFPLHIFLHMGIVINHKVIFDYLFKSSYMPV